MWRFIVKLILNGIVVVPLLMYFAGATFMGSMVAALGLSVIAYFIGDQMILRRSNNLVATVADAGLAFVYLWLVANFTGWNLDATEMLIIVAALGLVEWFFHGYLQRQDAEAAR